MLSSISRSALLMHSCSNGCAISALRLQPPGQRMRHAGTLLHAGMRVQHQRPCMRAEATTAMPMAQLGLTELCVPRICFGEPQLQRSQPGPEQAVSPSAWLSGCVWLVCLANNVHAVQQHFSFSIRTNMSALLQNVCVDHSFRTSRQASSTPWHDDAGAHQKAQPPTQAAATKARHNCFVPPDPFVSSPICRHNAFWRVNG